MKPLRPFLLLSMLMLFTILLSVCKKNPSEAENDLQGSADVSYFSHYNYPKVDGSTSAHPLQIVIACNILGLDYRWDRWHDETTRVYPEGTGDTQSFVKNIDHNGTHGSYVNLINREADLILVARLPSADEVELARNEDVTLDIKAIAIDAFVFILNTENSVKSLTINQIQGIYTGDIINWKDVGGINSVINAYTRNENSGSQELMKALVMKDLHMVDNPQMILAGMMGPINKLVDDPYGIGYTVYFFNQYMAPRDPIKVCAVNGVLPEADTISKRSYPFTTEVYAVIRAQTKLPQNARKLWNWLQTEAGQKTIGESGYVPVMN